MTGILIEISNCFSDGFSDAYLIGALNLPPKFHRAVSLFIVQTLKSSMPFISGRTLNPDERKDQCESLVKYVRETFHMHNFYAFKYFICDILNFVNVIGQLFLGWIHYSS